MNLKTLLVVADTPNRAFSIAVEYERAIRVKFGLAPGYIPEPYRAWSGKWTVWLDFRLPVDVLGLEVGEPLRLSGSPV